MAAPAEKQDAKKSYKGYQPNVSFIGRVPVHIENRNGNTPAYFEQAESLQQCFNKQPNFGSTVAGNTLEKIMAEDKELLVKLAK